MAISKIGNIHKLVYASKNFKSGITTISIKILKPNGSLHASGTMTEFSEAGFEGVYFYNVSTIVADPTGEYTAVITEGTHKAKAKITYVDDLGGGGGVSDSIDTIELELDISPKSIEMNLGMESMELLLEKGNMELETSNSSVIMNIDPDQIEMNIADESMELELECNN